MRASLSTLFDEKEKITRQPYARRGKHSDLLSASPSVRRILTLKNDKYNLHICEIIDKFYAHRSLAHRSYTPIEHTTRARPSALVLALYKNKSIKSRRVLENIFLLCYNSS